MRASRLLVVLVAGVLLAAAATTATTPSARSARCPEGAPPRSGRRRPRPRCRGSRQPEGRQGGDPNVVATGLNVPTGLVVLADGSAIVGERETGRLLQVFPDGSPAHELMTVPGVDTAGDGGLLGLALSPTYLEDGLLYAYMSTATDNLVRFPLGGTPNTVLAGIPRGDRQRRRPAVQRGRHPVRRHG